MTGSEVYDLQIRAWERDYRTKLHDLRDQYEARKPIALAVAARAENILRKNISDHRIKCEVTTRIKDFNSFRMKFRNKFHNYIEEYKKSVIKDKDDIDLRAVKIQTLLNNTFSIITDMVGIRCIGLFTKELYPFYRSHSNEDINMDSDYFILKEIIVNKFNNAEKDLKLPTPYADEKLTGGYRSVHYDLCLKQDSIVASLEQELLHIPFELQVRTYSQHMVDDVSHFLSYKSDDLFFSSSKFDDITAKLQDELIGIQISIDKLFEESRKEFDSLLYSLRKGDTKKLLDMSITPDTLKLYALYEFVILRKKEFYNLPTNRPEDVKFVDLWLYELSDGLKNIGFTTIREVQASARKGINFVADYLYQTKSRKSIFKDKDLTDILSKCLLFSEEKLRECYPIMPETRLQIEEFWAEKEKRPD